jgi:hypothetical protein
MTANATAAPGWYPGNGEKATACAIDSKAPVAPATSQPAKKTASAPSATGAATITIPAAKAGNYLATLPVASIKVGNVTAALVLTHGHTDTAWFPRLASMCDAVCFTRGRIGFLDLEGKKASPTQGQAIFLYGKDRLGLFDATFAEIGLLMATRKGLEGGR